MRRPESICQKACDGRNSISDLHRILSVGPLCPGWTLTCQRSRSISKLNRTMAIVVPHQDRDNACDFLASSPAFDDYQKEYQLSLPLHCGNRRAWCGVPLQRAVCMTSLLHRPSPAGAARATRYAARLLRLTVVDDRAFVRVQKDVMFLSQTISVERRGRSFDGRGGRRGRGGRIAGGDGNAHGRERERSSSSSN